VNDLINEWRMAAKEVFMEMIKKRTKQFAVDVIKYCNTLKSCEASSIIIYQLVKPATSSGVNYRAYCRARSKNEFFSKEFIVDEAADESEY
jgi:four helix bundle protein